MTDHVSILGTGGWGTALAVVLSGTPARVQLWGRRPDFVEELRSRRENNPYLPGITIPGSVQLTSDAREATENADLVIIAIPTQHIRDTLRDLKNQLNTNPGYISAAKGLETDTFKRPTEIIHDVIGNGVTTGVISGPSHAEEVGKGRPCTLVSSAEEEQLARQTAKALSTETTRIYTNPDLIGVELAGALKNIIAIAGGICHGRNLGMNAQSALIARGLVEISRIGEHLGARRSTFFGIAGLGDLITTCMSPHGRNRSVGVALGKGESFEEIRERMDKVAEGTWTTKALIDTVDTDDLHMPITLEVYRVLYEDKPVSDAVSDLMQRELRSEAEDLFYRHE